MAIEGPNWQSHAKPESGPSHGGLGQVEGQQAVEASDAGQVWEPFSMLGGMFIYFMFRLTSPGMARVLGTWWWKDCHVQGSQNHLLHHQFWKPAFAGKATEENKPRLQEFLEDVRSEDDESQKISHRG